ncbi:MAG: LysM peptidoglycan-binding domain-containing protein [Spirochaetes bacterium]|nr:LysM peptidoglycan-binding domain-containing protein [Spirochaetota bacterium]
MKKIFYFVLLIVFINNLFGADVQKIDLESNEYYQKALEYIKMAKENYSIGEYDKSYEYSEEAKEYLRKANELNILRAYIINSEKRKLEAEDYIAKLDKFDAKNFKDTIAFYDKANSTYDDGVKAIKDAESKTENDDKINYYATAISLFAESVNYSKSALSKLSLDYNTAKDMLDRAYSKRKDLMLYKVISENDENDKQIMPLLKESESSLNKSEFAQSVEKSREAMAIMDKIELEMMANYKTRAEEKLNQAKDAYNKALEKDAEKLYPDKMKDAKNNLDNAVSSMETGKYKDAITYSDNVMNIIGQFAYGKEGEEIFPKFYVVKLDIKKRDCLWRISNFTFIYNNRYEWKRLWEANKGILKNPENPHLIFPEQIIEIPSLKGEIREGYYDPNKKYPKFNPKKDYSK